MIDWKDIRIDYDKLPKAIKIINDHKNRNPACQLIKYWSERMPKRMEKDVFQGKLPYGYVGDGWPMESNQDAVLKIDKRNLKDAFVNPHYRDIGDAIYQCNTILDHAKYKDKLKVVDFGGGYGRLSIPFLHYLKKQVIYTSVDYVPLSLIIAPQFVMQAADCCILSMYGLTTSDVKDSGYFQSIPAWEIEFECVTENTNVFVSIHSFQEMTRDAVDFYIDIANKNAAKDAIFYSINIDPKDKYVPDSWELIFDRGVRFNRDGKYNEKMWVIK